MLGPLLPYTLLGAVVHASAASNEHGADHDRGADAPAVDAGNSAALTNTAVVHLCPDNSLPPKANARMSLPPAFSVAGAGASTPRTGLSLTRRRRSSAF